MKVKYSNTQKIKYSIDEQGNKAEQTITIRLKNVVPLPPPVQKRIALVIGNSNYKTIPRLNGRPLNDAEDIGAALKRLGFEVKIVKDANLGTLQSSIAAFTEDFRRNYDVGLFFYAGHSLGMNGNNYILPTEFVHDIKDTLFQKKCVSTNELNQEIQQIGEYNKTFICILDACRTGGRSLYSLPLWETKSAKTPSGSIFCYAASQGETASNGTGRNGLYTSILLKHIETPKLEIKNLFTKVRNEIHSYHAQEPEESVKLYKEFYFKE